MKFGVVVFPGSNCDLDAYHLIKDVLNQPVDYLWHKETSVKGYDCIILPGGFSYGDYLRAGAIARFSPIMEPVIDFAARGGLVIGICNGFQILLEAGLLPGALYRNNHLKFRCQFVYLRVERDNLPFTCKAQKGQVLRIPIAHGEGNYFCNDKVLKQLLDRRQLVFRYVNREGEVTPEANPNGSVENIAGVCNEMGNVLGMMPHPERAGESLLGSKDGQVIFNSILNYWSES